MERPETGVDDPLGAGDSPRQDDLLPRVFEIVVDAGIEPWLRGAPVLERGVRCCRTGNAAGRSPERLLCQEASRHLVGEMIGRRCGVAGADSEEAAAVEGAIR